MRKSQYRRFGINNFDRPINVFTLIRLHFHIQLKIYNNDTFPNQLI